MKMTILENWVRNGRIEEVQLFFFFLLFCFVSIIKVKLLIGTLSTKIWQIKTTTKKKGNESQGNIFVQSGFRHF